MPAIHVKSYEHYNRSFKNWNTPKGRYIGSKAEYEKALREEGMITEDEARKRGLVQKSLPKKQYELSKDSINLLNSVNSTKDSKGRIRASERQIKALKEKFKYNPQALKDLGL